MDILKLIAMIPVVSATSTQCEPSRLSSSWQDARYSFARMKTASSPVIHFITEENEEKALLQKMLFNVITKFESDIIRLPEAVSGHEAKARKLFSEALLEIGMLDVTNVVVSLTNSHSIYFRFNNGPYLETHLELFFDNEDDGIEAVTTVYKNDQVILKVFGDSSLVFSKIRNKINKSSSESLAVKKERDAATIQL